MDQALALTTEQHQSLPEDARGNYIERDGIFVLDLKPVTVKVGDDTRHIAVENISGLKSTLNKYKSAITDLSGRVDNYKLDDGSYLDPNEAREAMTKLKEFAEAPTEGDIQKQVDQRVETIRAQLEAKGKKEVEARDSELETRNKKLSQREQQLQRLLVDNQATQAIAGAKGNVEVLLPHIQKRCRCIEIEDGQDYILEVLDANGEAMYSATSGAVKKATMADLVEEFKNHNSFASLFEGSNARGSGAHSGQPGNARPFSITKDQAQNPRVYQELKKKAEAAGQQIQFVE